MIKALIFVGIGAIVGMVLIGRSIKPPIVVKNPTTGKVLKLIKGGIDG